MDAEEVIMLTRSILASKKHGISLPELQSEYFELNGTRLPFREIGFESSLAFLKSFPDKFTVQKNNFNEMIIKATIDPQMEALAKLVAGQKTNKKKKKNKSKKKKFVPPQTFSRFDNNNKNFSRPFRFYKPFFDSLNVPLKEKQPVKSLEQGNHQSVNRWRSSTSSLSDGTRNDSPCKLNSKNEILIANQRNVLPAGLKSNTPTKKANDFSVATSPFIENASYFLKEANVMLTHFETCETVYIRIVSDMFSAQYEKLNEKLNVEYAKNKTPLGKIELEMFCVAYDQIKKSFHRVQIKKINENRIVCFYLDEGRTNTINANDLFVLKEEYLKTKFQAIKVELLDFDQFKNNNYVVQFLRNEYTNKTYLAKRHLNQTPIKIILYEAHNKCLNERLLDELQNFIPIQLEVNQTFEAKISFIDKESSIVYLLFENEFKAKLKDKIKTVNEYLKQKVKQNHLTNQNMKLEQSMICFAKYEDDFWYRAKVLLKKPEEKKVLVHFIDFGNKELVPLEDIFLIDSFNYLKHLPSQAIQVFITNYNERLSDLYEYLYETESIKFEVTHVNNSGVATVDIIGLSTKSPISSNIDSSESSSAGSSDYEASQSDEMLSKMSQLEFEDPNEIVTLLYSDLEKNTLKDKSHVYVMNQNNPTDFSLCLESSLKDFETFKKSMNEFYSQNESKYKIKETIIKDGIYVYRDDNNEYHRIKTFMSLRGVRVFRIDTGNYDVTKPDAIFYITRRFAKFKPIVFRASLGLIKYDRVDNWSEQARVYFKQQIENKLLQVDVLDQNIETETYIVDLYDRKESISKVLIEKGFALSI